MSTIKTETLSTPSNATVPVDTVVNGSAKAWVNFNGTGTVAIRRAFNVSSVTDYSTGKYTVTFDTDMQDANYAVLATSGGTNGRFTVNSPETGGEHTISSTTVTCYRDSTSSYDDSLYMNVAVFS